MPAKRVIILPKVLLPEGIRLLGPVTIPDGLTDIELTLEHDGGVLPGIAWGLMLSLDGGVTWRPHGAAGTVGAQVELTNGFRVRLPPGPSRQVKGFLWLSAEFSVGVSVTIQ